MISKTMDLKKKPKISSHTVVYFIHFKHAQTSFLNFLVDIIIEELRLQPKSKQNIT